MTENKVVYQAIGWLYDTHHHETGRDDVYTDTDPTGKPGAENIRRVYRAYAEASEENMTNELKPCPFCAGTEIDVFPVQSGLTMIHCVACHATVSFGGREGLESTLSAWNYRGARLADDDALVVAVQRYHTADAQFTAAPPGFATAKPVPYGYVIRHNNGEELFTNSSETAAAYKNAMVATVTTVYASPALSAPAGLADVQRVIDRLMSSDPNFDDCEEAANMLRQLATAPPPKSVPDEWPERRSIDMGYRW